MFDKDIYEQEMLDEAPITPRALMTEVTNTNMGGIMSSSNGKFKTSRGPTALNEKLSTERLSSSFYVDDDEDEERDENTFDEEKNIETYDNDQIGAGLRIDLQTSTNLNQTVIH